MPDFFYTDRPVVDMREHPEGESKIVSQSYFGERVEVLDDYKEKIRIRTSDEYEGWVEKASIIRKERAYGGSIPITRLQACIYDRPDTEYGPVCFLPYGSCPEILEVLDTRWIKILFPDERVLYIQTGDLISEFLPKIPGDLPRFAKKFLGIPYVWGGRSGFGYDCSGFIQMIYRKLGIFLRRDAREQIFSPDFEEVSDTDLQPGDLLFWGKSQDRITHVGMYAGKGKFLHTSAADRENQPWVRISKSEDPDWKRGSIFRPYRSVRRLRSEPIPPKLGSLPLKEPSRD